MGSNFNADGEYRQDEPEMDLSADTERFRRFARQHDGEPEQPVATGGAVGVPFRLITLGIGIVVLAVIIWLLFFL